MHKTFIRLLLVACFFVFPVATFATFGDTTTFVGQIVGGDGKDKMQAYFDQPADLAIDSNGNFYLADKNNNVIRKIASNGVVSSLAGTGAFGDTIGAASEAEFAWPEAIAVSGSTVYVADTENSKIKKISGGNVETLVETGLSHPKGLYVDSGANRLYISDSDNNAIKYVSLSGGSVTTLATGLSSPLKLSKNGNLLYVACRGDNTIKVVDITDGSVGTLASEFLEIDGVYYHGGHLYVVDGNGLIDYLFSVDPTTGEKEILAVDYNMIYLNSSSGVFVYDNHIWALNQGSSQIYRFDMDGANPTHYAGKDRFGNDNGSKDVALLGGPKGIVMSNDRAYMYLSENNKIRKINRETGEAFALIGNSVDNYKEGKSGSSARFSDITALTISPDDTTLYVSDRNNNRIRGVDIATQTDFLITGAGEINSNNDSDNGYQEGTKCSGEYDALVSGCAYFNRPTGITIDPDGNFLYVADTGNHRIRRVRISDGETALIAGSGQEGFVDGTEGSAKLSSPYSVAIDAAGENLYVADKGNHAIRKIQLSNRKVTTVAGTGKIGYLDATFDQAVFSYPEYLTVGADGNVYVSESGGHRVRQLDMENEVTKLISGSGVRGFLNGSKDDTKFSNPKGIVIDEEANTLYVADSMNDMIRSVDIEGEAPYTEPAPTITRVDPNTKTPASSSGVTLFVELTGTNFRHGAVAYIGTLKSVHTYVESSTKIAAEIPFGLMGTGHWDVTVANADLQDYTLLDGFRVSDASGTIPDTHHNYDGSTTGEGSGSPTKSTFTPYASNLYGGFNVQSCDLDGDGVSEILTGTGVGFGPQVRAFDEEGNERFSFFAYAETLRAGVRVSCGDLDKDNVPEIVVSPGPGGRPHIRIFDNEGILKNPGFFALDGKFQGGAYTAVGDINGDRVGDIIVTAGKGGGPQVTVHKITGTMIANFFAYDASFRGGIRPTALDFDNDGQDEILTGPEFGAPHIQMFTVEKNNVRRLNPGFYAFSPDYGGGVSVCGCDTTGDGLDEIIVGVGADATPLIRVFNKDGSSIIQELQAFSDSFSGGVNVACGDTDGDGVGNIMAMPRSEGTPDLRVYE